MFKRIFQTFVLKVMVGLFSLVTVLLTSQYLGTQGRGTASLILTSIAIILVVCNIIGGPAMVFLVPRTPVSNLLLPSTLWAIILAIGGTFILSLFHLVDAVYIPHILILSLLNSLSQNNMMILLGKERTLSFNLLGMLQALLIVITVAFCFVVLNYNEVWAYVIALYVAYIASFMAGSILIYRYLRSFTFSAFGATFKKMINYGILVQLSATFSLITYRLGYYMIEAYQGRSAVGIFSVGVSLSEAIWLVAGSFGLILFSKVANTEDRNVSQLMTLHLVRMAGIITFIVLLMLVLLPASFFSIIFGQGFGQVHEVILWLSPGILFFSIVVVLNPYFSGTGQYRIATMAAATGFIVIVIFNSLLIPRFGIKGAALASSLAYFAMCFFQVAIFRKQSTCGWKDFVIRREDFKQGWEEIKSAFIKSTPSGNK